MSLGALTGASAAAAVYAETPNLQLTTFLKHSVKFWVPIGLVSNWLRRGKRGSSQEGTVFFSLDVAYIQMFIFASSELEIFKELPSQNLRSRGE